MKKGRPPDHPCRSHIFHYDVITIHLYISSRFYVFRYDILQIPPATYVRKSRALHIPAGNHGLAKPCRSYRSGIYPPLQGLDHDLRELIWPVCTTPCVARTVVLTLHPFPKDRGPCRSKEKPGRRSFFSFNTPKKKNTQKQASARRTALPSFHAAHIQLIRQQYTHPPEDKRTQNPIQGGGTLRRLWLLVRPFTSQSCTKHPHTDSQQSSP